MTRKHPIWLTNVSMSTLFAAAALILDLICKGQRWIDELCIVWLRSGIPSRKLWPVVDIGNYKLGTQQKNSKYDAMEAAPVHGRNPAPLDRWSVPVESHYLQCFIVTNSQQLVQDFLHLISPLAYVLPTDILPLGAPTWMSAPPQIHKP